MRKIMLASANAHKTQEFEEMLRPLGYTMKTSFDLKEDIEIEETGTTFRENALTKTKTTHERLGIRMIANDSGLAINALDSTPGIYSTRLMGRDTSCDVKNQYLVDQCRRAEGKDCQFVYAIAYVQTGGSEHVFTGIIEGIVTDHIKGTKGFGYDPIFYYPPYRTTSTNVGEGQKNHVSHRERALTKLVAFMEKEK